MRVPYVGKGPDGARRSAIIDREEANTLDDEDPRRRELEASAARWDTQADDLEAAYTDRRARRVVRAAFEEAFPTRNRAPGDGF